MQFDDSDLENDNNAKPEGNSESISWEDLLNSDKEIEVSGAVRENAIKSEASGLDLNNESEDALDFDLDLLTDEALGLNSPLLEQDNSQNAAPASNAEGGEISAQEEKKSPASIFDSLVKGEEVQADEEFLSTEEDSEPVPVEDEENKEFNLSDTANEYVNSFGAEDTGVEPAEPSGGSKTKPYTADDKLRDILNEEPEGLLSGGASGAGKTAGLQDDTQELYLPSDTKKPVLLFVFIGLIGVLAVIFLLLTFVFAPRVDKEVALGPDSGYEMGSKDNIRKQTEDLIDKVENSRNDDDVLNSKREIIAVKFAGRTNPFVPASAAGDGIFGSELSSPPDILDTPAAREARKLLSIAVSGIMYDPDKPSAIIRFDNSDFFLQKGDRIDTYTVRTITKDYVVIGNGANTYRAYVGEAFKEDEKVPESKQMKYLDGHRQYISSDDIQISTK